MKLVNSNYIRKMFIEHYPNNWNKAYKKYSSSYEDFLDFAIYFKHWKPYKPYPYIVNIEQNTTRCADVGKGEFNSHSSIQVDKYIYRNVLDVLKYMEFCGYEFSVSQILDIENVLKSCEKIVGKRGQYRIVENHVKDPEIFVRPKPQQKTYLMKDNNTGLYKIGKSKNPKNREKTLQSEKPTLKMVKIWSKNIEKHLHYIYKEQRVRGEWFELTPIQVKYICTHY